MLISFPSRNGDKRLPEGRVLFGFGIPTGNGAGNGAGNGDAKVSFERPPRIEIYVKIFFEICSY